MKKNVLWGALTLAAFAAASASGCRTPAPPKVVVVGLDGLTWTFLNPLLKNHQLPNLEAVLHGSASGELETFRPTKSGILWTSIATGKTMQKHGITDWTFVDREAREEIERLRLVTGTRRTAAAIWEILSERGRSVAVANWWITYPAKPLNGFLITDRLREVIDKKEIADQPDVVYPASLVDELRPLFLDSTGALRTLLKFGFSGFTPAKADAMFYTSKPSRNLYASLLSYVGEDQMAANWALHLFRKGQPQFFGVILRITDVYAHFAWRFADRATLERIAPQIEVDSLMNEDPAVRDRALSLVDELDHAVARAMLPAYKFADQFVGEIVSAMEPNSILVIVSDHGFMWGGGGYDHNPSAGSKGKYPRTSPPGVIILKGDGIRPVRIEGAKLFDVTPTILYALGEPVAEDMDGRALTEVFRQPLFFGKREERFVRTYGTGARPAGDTSPTRAAEKEILEDLRGLGYISTEDPSGPGRGEGLGTDPASSNRRRNGSAPKPSRHASRTPIRKRKP